MLGTRRSWHESDRRPRRDGELALGHWKPDLRIEGEGATKTDPYSLWRMNAESEGLAPRWGASREQHALL